MAAYVSIAVDNAHAYDEVMQSRSIIERKNNDIMDSLRYAETIQKSVLPTSDFINQYVASHFVIFRPKDVVSGDFYWCKNVGNKFFTAVVDCTGHGVPGAFMGLIGNDLLDNIIVRDRVFDPAQILEGMHEGIRRVLQQDKQLNSDGMDLGLCMIEYQESGNVSVVYAGAKRPLYYWNGSELQEVKGDRRSVGGWQKDTSMQFTNNTLLLQKGNTLYLTTDGFIDQSSPLRKKYGSIRLTEQIRSIASLDMEAQCRHLEQELNTHRGNQDQRDDITVMGILL
jgi:serine phosphatase RsbU (regulator of sigma subunit)